MAYESQFAGLINEALKGGDEHIASFILVRRFPCIFSSFMRLSEAQSHLLRASAACGHNSSFRLFCVRRPTVTNNVKDCSTRKSILKIAIARSTIVFMIDFCIIHFLDINISTYGPQNKPDLLVRIFAKLKRIQFFHPFSTNKNFDCIPKFGLLLCSRNVKMRSQSVSFLV